MCELSRFFTGQERNQSFKFRCRLVRVVAFFDHQMFKFPDCLIVIHRTSSRKIHRTGRARVSTLAQKNERPVVKLESPGEKELKWEIFMPLKMHAAVVEQFGKPLSLLEWDVPSPRAGQILVKTEPCGVCHTDLHAAHGDWPVKPTLPFIPGHEAIGLVAAVGSGVTIVKEGDRVGVPWLYSACGHCEYCLRGWETVCAEAQFGGYTRNGGFADYVIADPNYVAHVPAGLTAAEAAPLICAGITSYKGIKETQARPGEWIAISGAGGLGHLAIQYAKAMGLLVCAIDIDDGKLAHATRLGADFVINAKTGDPAAAVKKATGGGAHGVLITAPSLIAFKQGVGMTRKRGTCVLVELQPLSSINQIFDRLEHGDVPSRVVLDFASPKTKNQRSEQDQQFATAGA